MFLTRYDFRAPGADSGDRRELFARALEQATYVDQQGRDLLALSEHHASDDGYLPSPLTVAAAMAARTERISISIAALLVNLYDPIRLAEDIAVLDHLSAGRISYTLGLGYRPEEYAALRRPWATRGADADDLVARCRRRELRVVTTHPLCAGLPAKASWENLRLIGEQVIPTLRGTSLPETGLRGTGE